MCNLRSRLDLTYPSSVFVYVFLLKVVYTVTYFITTQMLPCRSELTKFLASKLMEEIPTVEKIY